MAVGRRIGNALLQAMETATAAMEMQQKQKESKALERYRNAQAAHLERQGGFLDRLADTYNLSPGIDSRGDSTSAGCPCYKHSGQSNWTTSRAAGI